MPAQAVSFIRRPEEWERVELYQAVAMSAMSGGLGVAVKDRALLERLTQAQLNGPGHDITPPGHADNEQTMYLVEGRIFVRVVGWAGPANAQWYEVQPPRFFA